MSCRYGHVFIELSHISISDSKDQPKSLVPESESTVEKSAAEAVAPSEDQSGPNKSPKRKNDECTAQTTKKVSALLTTVIF